MELEVPVPDGAKVSEEELFGRIDDIKENHRDFFRSVREASKQIESRDNNFFPEDVDTEYLVLEGRDLSWLCCLADVLGVTLGEAASVVCFSETVGDIKLLTVTA